MKKFAFYGLSLLLLAGLVVGLPSCKEDEPVIPPKLSFGDKTLTFKESDGEVEIELVLDKAAATDIEIDYTISGTALEKVKAGANAAYDYEITSDYLETKILKGETKGIITLEFTSDLGIEEDETIEIQIEDVIGADIEITRDDEVNITLKQEDGLLVVLEWGVGTGESYKDVDMDLIFWATNTTTSTLVPTQFGAFSASVASPEFFFLPTAVLVDGTYGWSCTYYSGTVDPMNFQVVYRTWINDVPTIVATKKGTYKLVNINRYDDPVKGTDLQLAMTFKKAGTGFNTFSDITVPATGSRTIGGQVPEGMKKGDSPKRFFLDLKSAIKGR